MDLVLKKLSPNSIKEQRTPLDLFDSKGRLLLAKGSLITSNVLAKLKRQEVYKMETRNEKRALIKAPKTIKEFSKDVYVKLVGCLWRIYHEAQLLQPQHIEKMLALVKVIMEELRTKDTFLDLEGNRINLERYKQHDFGTYMHVLNVALLSAIIGLQLNYNENKLKNLILGALLHDLGKLQVPKEILNKPGILTEEERDVIKQHPLLGEEMLKDARLISSVLATIKEHHERWNGRGYPFGLKGQEIYQDAQIVAVADVYEALTADRPYRKGLPPYQALEMIIGGSGTDFNPRFVKAFQESLVLYPEGSLVTLNTGEIGVVAAIPLNMPTRPLLRLLYDQEGQYFKQTMYVDLLQDLTRFIKRLEFNQSE